MHIKHYSQNKPLHIFIITTLAATLVLRCMPVASQLSKGKAQDSAALDVDHSPALKVLLAQEQQWLEEIDALIRTMSLEELVTIVMLDVEDSNDHSIPIAEKPARMHRILDDLPLKEARDRVSKALIEECLANWKNRDITWTVCKHLNAGEKLKTVTNDKVRRYIELYRAVLEGYMSQSRYKQR